MIVSIAVAYVASLGPVEFGLKPGTVHEYETRDSEGKVSRQKTTVVSHKVIQGIDAFDIKLHNGRHEFYGVSNAGLVQFHVGNMEGTQVDKSAKPIPLYLRNKKVAEPWSWIEEFRGQTMAGPDGKGPDMERLKSTCDAKIAEIDSFVKVPAGTFKTVHIVINRKSLELGNSVEDVWIATGTGIVKRIRTYQKWWTETVMTK